MSISSIVTRGYGSWGSVNDLPTRGYTIGAAAMIYPNPDNAAFVIFRDKRGAVLFRDKRAAVLFRDKRAEAG